MAPLDRNAQWGRNESLGTLVIEKAILLRGASEPSPERHALRAGPLSLCFEAGDLRYVRLGEHEVLRRVYAAVRDQNWVTVPGALRDVSIEARAESFRVSFLSEHREREIHFEWRGEIEGRADGSIRFVFDGNAKTTFLRNRIGFCVLHPAGACAGARCRALYLDGTEHETTLPHVIAVEQPFAGLHDLAGIAHEVSPGAWAEVRFEGDAFEVEDQRNWTDASFKTFCTPLRLPFPVEIRAGTRVLQSVNVRIVGGEKTVLATRAVCEREAVTISVDSSRAAPLLPLGLCASSDSACLTPREIERLRDLRPAHLRVEARLSQGDWPARLDRAARDACALGAELELVVYSSAGDPGRGFDAVAKRIEELRAPVVRVLPLEEGRSSTTRSALDAARKHLAALRAPIGGGTDADLYELNLERPPADADFIVWSMNPQVHASDCASIVETPEAAAQQVESVGAYFPGKPRFVSPISLKPRFNAVATGPEAALAPGALPRNVDPRQMSLFGAAWTLAMLSRLAQAGAAGLTLFETVGWRGVMESESGSPLPGKFRSTAGEVFPLYHVLAAAAAFSGGEVLATKSSDALAVEALALRSGQRTLLLLANLSGREERVCVEGWAGSGERTIGPYEIVRIGGQE